MDKERALNIARGCVATSYLTAEEKKEVLDALNELESEDKRRNKSNGRS